MKNLILGALIVVSISSCMQEKNEVGRYQTFLNETGNIYITDTKTGIIYYINDHTNVRVLDIPNKTKAEYNLGWKISDDSLGK
jgi:hypothetical protein